MKKCSSVVWRFFDRIENEHQRCFAVLCKLCDTQYKFFGNTTNLRSHLLNKHPLQWELSQNGTFDESSFRVEDDESNQSTAAASPKRRKYNKSYKDKNVRYSVSVDNARNSPGGRIPKIEIQRVDVLENTDVDNVENENEENEATYNLVRQLHDNRGSDEEWLEEDHYGLDTFGHEPKRKRAYRKIKREVQSPPRRSSTYKPASYKSPIVIESNSNKDEYSVFGEYIANKLRKFKAPRTRGNLQQLITTIMWQAEYGLYDNADAVKRLLLYTVTEHEQAHEIQTHIQTEEIIEHNDEPNQSVESESLPTVN